MDKIIREIINEANFNIVEKIKFNREVINVSDIFFAERTENQKFDYFLIVQLKEKHFNKEILNAFLDNCLELILNNIKVKGLEKNLSLLVLLETETLAFSKERNKFIYDLEEDPYSFKKYVLAYTNEQITYLNESLNNQSQSLIESLQLLIQTKKLFTSFKMKELDRNEDEEREAILYDLVSKIFIKLPFLRVEMNKQSLPILKKEIEDSITIEDAVLTNKFLNLYLEKKEPNIEDILFVLGVDEIE
jgi:hypothetical protein